MIRSSDIAARIGGDEFGLILDRLDHNSALDTAERLSARIAASPLDAGGTMIKLEATIGTAAVMPGDTTQDVLQRADRNMYRAKTSQRSFR